MQTGRVPELPEVHALAADLESRLHGHVIDRLDITSFAALKTFDPPVSALHGMLVAGVGRHAAPPNYAGRATAFVATHATAGAAAATNDYIAGDTPAGALRSGAVGTLMGAVGPSHHPQHAAP